MKITIIGSAAGGGFPQWNCNAPLSRAVRQKKPGFLARTQSSIAVSANGRDWALFNASPDIREQIAASPCLQPRSDGPLRHSPIRSVVLTNADVDHIAGLLSLREREPFVIYATARVLETLRTNSIFRVLNTEVVERRELPLDGSVDIEGPQGPIGIRVDTFTVPGKVALFLEDNAPGQENFGTELGDTIGVRIRPQGGGPAAYYIPGCAQIDAALKARLSGAACLMFDGTVYHDTEMHDTGVGEKTGQRMGHISMSGKNGSLQALGEVEIERRIYVHINNTNPVLDPGSDAAKTVQAAGWEIAFDGMEIDL